MLFFLVFGIGKIYAQEALTEFRIEFQAGSAIIEPTFADNAQHLAEITAFITRVNEEHTDEIINVTFGGFTPPEGSMEYNENLMLLRRQTIENYFRERMEIPMEKISYSSDCGIAWEKVRSHIEQSDYRYKEEILNILNEEPTITEYHDSLTIDYRILRLKELHAGLVWKYMERYFPEIRYANANAQFATRKEIIPATENIQETITEEVGNTTTVFSDSIRTADDTRAEEICKEQPLALKTNILYDAILMPSLEIEYKINGHWSVSLEGDVAWWKKDAKHKYYQIATISPEARYKFKSSRPWHGHYVGAFTGFSWYDLENGGRGYRGEAGMLGLSYSHLWSVNRSLSLEAGIGAGVMLTRYKEYQPIDGHYVYQQTSRLTYAGPLKIKFALVWRLWNKNCKGGKQ